jgi:small GTP-binding protein
MGERNGEKKHLCVGLLAHVDAGKTTLSEGLLYVTGNIKKLGRVDHRDTYLDTHELERARGITIFSKQALLQTETMELTLLDTPGHVDFSGEMERTLPVLDYGVLVISGIDGVQAHTETLWALLKRYHIPTFVFITKMDVANGTRAQLMAELQARLSPACVDFSDPAQAAQTEALAMVDETALDEYMDTGCVSRERIADLVAQRKLFCCCFGSGLKLDGVETFLSLLENYTIAPTYGAEFGAKVFKIARDAQGNRLTYVKVTGGKLSVRQEIAYTDEHGQVLREKISQVRRYSGQKYENADTVAAGGVCALLGLTKTHPGQGLGAEPDGQGVMLEPALGYRLVLPKGCDERTMLPKLRLLEEEEPLLHILWQPNLGEIQVQLMGAVQIEVLKSLIRERFDVEVQVDSGHILYRETIASTVEGVGHFEPLRHYAEVHLLLEPGERGSGLVLDTVCSEDVLDLNWQRLILTHLEEKQHLGVLTGSPLTDVKITLLTGRAHLKHTEGGDFRQATYRAVRQGLMQAESVLLEPYYAFRLEVPAAQIGRAITDIRAMGGEHEAPQAEGDRMVLTGEAPVAGMADYFAEVVAYTRGKGHLSCHMAGYRPCHNAQAVIQAMNYDPEADGDNTPSSVFCAHGAGFTVPWNQVFDYMHLDSGLKKDTPAADWQPRVYHRNLDIDEKELEEIMEREFGAIRRKQYTAPVVNSAQTLWVQQRKKERLLVDGYNVIHAWDELKELAQTSLDVARGRLMDMLASYQGYTKSEVVLVFDAYGVAGGQGSKTTQDGFHVAFTPEGETADMYIERLANEIGKNESVRVVTSDSLVGLTALRSGVLRTSSRAFQDEVYWVLEQIHDIVKRSQE